MCIRDRVLSEAINKGYMQGAVLIDNGMNVHIIGDVSFQITNPDFNML